MRLECNLGEMQRNVGTRSSVMTVPSEVRSELVAGWRQGKTLDELHAIAPGVSRAALYRFVRRNKLPQVHIVVHSHDPVFLDALERLLSSAQASERVTVNVE